MKNNIPKTRFVISVRCAPGEKIRVYGRYVNYFIDSVISISQNLPEKWEKTVANY